LIPYARGEAPVFFRAELRTEILDALKLAEELELKAVVVGGGEAWKVTEALLDAEVPVILAGSLRLPGEATEPYDAPYANAAKLHEAEIPFALRAGSSTDAVTSARNLPFEAAVA